MSEREVAKEQVKLNQLRQRLPDIISEDAKFQEDVYLIAWLKAGKFNVDKSEAIVREAVKWRKENKVDEAGRTPFHPELAKCFRVYTDGTTKSGYAAWSANAGEYRFRDTLAKYGKDAVIHHWIQLLIQTEEMILRHNREALARKEDHETLSDWPASKKCWLILNMKSLSYTDVMSRDVVSVFLTIVKIAVTYFPTNEGTLCFVNAGKLMEIVVKLLRPLLRGSSVELQVFDSNEARWKAFIHQHVDPEQIREPFGGYRRVSLCFT